MSQQLNPLTIPLAQTNLIEASAGTGKTWNIAALFLRMILLPLPNQNKPLNIDKILVVTFTKAATAELKTRLRARLDEAWRVLQDTPNATLERLNQHYPHEANFLNPLLMQAIDLEKDPETAQRRVALRLQAAINDFDNAAVYTIHGFCQRVLQDFAFLCGVPFEIQLDEEADNSIYLAAAQDFWRKYIAHDAIFAPLVFRYRETPKNQIDNLKSFLARPYLNIREVEANTSGRDYAQVIQLFEQNWQTIQHNLAEIQTLFWQNHSNLNGNSFRQKTFEDKFTQLNALLGSQPSAKTVWHILKNSNDISPFSIDFLQEKTKKGKFIPAEHLDKIVLLDDLAQSAYELMEAESKALILLNHRLLKDLRETITQRKKHSPQRNFDDLLLDVYLALQSEHGTELAQSIARNWHAALIDEFQDTDPLQYTVFAQAFAKNQTPLFLVGDPKQAIYSFRGADIYAYLQAAEDAQNRFTLDTNHRSHAQLIDSISSFFQRDNPFVLPKIAYQPIQAARGESRLQPLGNSLNIRWLHQPDDENVHADLLSKRAAQYCALEIAQLLKQSQDGQLLLKNKKLQASDIAVLVRARKDGVLVQRELKKRQIQSVLLSRDSIFAEPEAEALAALLDFLIQPQQTGLLRFVLASVLFEYDAAQLQLLNQDENQLLKWIDSAEMCLQTWREKGIYAALQQFFTQHQVETYLLTQGNERTLTNLHQLMELLAQEDELSHTPTSLRQWLGQHIQATREKSGGNEHILRLESDENLVKIVTMHASKGLQYPIVFCPFIWKANHSSSAEWQIIHAQQRGELVHQTQLEETDKNQMDNEQLSEDLRLVYVAMTRAEEQLNLYMASYKFSDKTPFAYLLNCQEESKNIQLYQNVWKNLAEKEQHNPRTDIAFHTQKLARNQVFDWERDFQNEIFQAEVFPERYFQFIRHASFTSLSRQTERAQNALLDNLPELDLEETLVSQENQLIELIELNEDKPLSVAQFPQGAATGLCWHDILEKMNPQISAFEQTDLIQESLQKYGFDAEIWLDVMTDLMEKMRLTPLLTLNANNSDNQGVALADVPFSKRLMEMDFLFYTQDFRLQDIQDWLMNSDLPLVIRNAVQQLHFYDIKGFLSGFIDLVFQHQQETVILDYKSNYLGGDESAYSQGAIELAIAENHYYLQAFIYAIATARYLQSRHALPEYLEIRYVFLRGLMAIKTQENQYHGIWAWRIRTVDLAQWL